MYVQFDDLQAIRVGRFKEYNSINNLTSSKYITMIERAGIVNAISPDRNSGAGKLWEINENTTAALGLFKETSNGFSDNSGEWSVTGRLTHLLADTLHLGASASARGGSDTDVSTRPGHHMDGRITLSDDGRAEDSSLYGLETAWLNGPFSLQAEYISQSFDSANEAEVSGYYVMASWFTTGEHRPYNKSIGAFSRVVPSGDGGAYELTARMDHSAGEDTDRVEVDDLIVGINWYTGRNSRIMLNYVMADINDRRNQDGLRRSSASVPSRLLMTPDDLVGRIRAGLIQKTLFLAVSLSCIPQALSATPQDGPEFHGRLMIDFPGLDTPGDDPRSLRLKINGEFQTGIDWKAQFEAGSFELDFKEFYLDGALGNHARARVGQFREPMGLDGQTSLEVIPFPERSAPTQAFTPGRNLGVMLHGGHEIHWDLGVFADSSEAFDAPGSERAISARLYGAPQDGSKGILHLGLAASFRNGHSTGLQFSAGPGAHGSPQTIDTGLMPDARAATLALELAHASDQWTTVAELMASSVQLPQKRWDDDRRRASIYSLLLRRRTVLAGSQNSAAGDACNPKRTRSRSNGRPVCAFTDLDAQHD